MLADTASGRNTKRHAEFKKRFAKCRASNVDLNLTKSVSRFGRNFLEAIQALRRLCGLNVDVYCEKENIRLSDPTAQHVIEIHCALAQNEIENKSHSIKWGIKAGFQSGASGYQHFACYGYRYDEKKQTLVTEPKEAVRNACLNVKDIRGILLHRELGSQYTSQVFERPKRKGSQEGNLRVYRIPV